MKKIFRIFKKLLKLDYFLLIKIFKIVIKKDYSKYPPYVKEFESKISEIFNIKYVLTFSSGSAAFYASLLALNLRKKSKVLISCMTFPSIINVLKKFEFEIYYFELDQKFNPINDTNINSEFDLLIITHPFGLYIDSNNLQNLLKTECKKIYDCSNSHGLQSINKDSDHVIEADISFFSIQGNKSISGGEGGVVLTNNKIFYETMINNHHPGHILNSNKNIAGAINDLKLRMHPIAACIGFEDLKKFKLNNSELKNKAIKIYEFLDHNNISHPYNTKFDISGFHYGLPFFYKEKISDEIVKEYNWYSNLKDENIRPISNLNKLSIINEIYFLDLSFIKNNDLKKILIKLKKIFKC
jgi:dTDP-4-amino-4,6-dideoxygalactose transaminase